MNREILWNNMNQNSDSYILVQSVLKAVKSSEANGLMAVEK